MEMDTLELLRTLAIIIITSKIFGLLARDLRAPQVAGEIIAGLLIGPSLLNLVRTVISLRHQEKDLQADGDFRVICSEPGRPFVYQRGNLLLAVNPSGKEQVFETELTGKLVIYSVGAPVYDSTVGQLRLGPQSFVILK